MKKLNTIDIIGELQSQKLSKSDISKMTEEDIIKSLPTLAAIAMLRAKKVIPAAVSIASRLKRFKGAKSIKSAKRWAGRWARSPIRRKIRTGVPLAIESGIIGGSAVSGVKALARKKKKGRIKIG